MSNKKFRLEDVLDYVWNGNDSEISDLSDEESENEVDFEINCIHEYEPIMNN